MCFFSHLFSDVGQQEKELSILLLFFFNNCPPHDAPPQHVHACTHELFVFDARTYLRQDYSAYFYPVLSGSNSNSSNTKSSNTNTTTTNIYLNSGAGGSGSSLKNRPRQQGRLKLCSRGLLFEPADRLLPLVKYPFRHMETQMEPVGAGAAAVSYTHLTLPTKA